MRGGETAMWGEGINKDNVDEYVWRGAAAAAERLWSPQDQTAAHADAAGRFAEFLCRMAVLGVRAGPIGPGFCPSDAAPVGAAQPAAAALSAAIDAAARSSAPQRVVLTLEEAQLVQQALAGQFL